MSNPIVSVIIPVYCATEEHEKFLFHALISVSEQTFRDFEVIIVDDVSPRDISPIIARAGELPRLQIIRNETNLRHAASRNIGAQAAKGEFIAFLDHDDLWEPEKLERQLEIFRKNPEAAMVFSGVKAFGSHSQLFKIDQSKIPTRPNFEWFMRHGNYVITASAVMVRKKALEEIGLFDTRYTTSDDLDAWLKISLRWPLIFMAEPLTGYRMHSANVNYSVDRLNDTRLLLKHYLDFYKKAPIRTKLRLSKTMLRKFGGQIYFRFFRKPKHPDS